MADFARGWYDSDLSYQASIAPVVRYFANTLPEEDRTRYDMSAGVIINWFYYSMGPGPKLSDEFYEHVIQKPTQHCKAEVCKAMKWDGNADVSGVGVRARSWLVGGNGIDG